MRNPVSRFSSLLQALPLVVGSFSLACGGLSLLATDTAAAPGSPWVAGYYVGYQRDLYPPELVDFSALTHLIVGRAVPRSDGTLDRSMDIDAASGPRLAKRLTGLAHAHHAKALLMVGGAGTHDAWVAAAGSATRGTFVRNLLGAVADLGFDGLDLDWEPLADADFPAALALVQALRAASPNLLLAMPVGWINPNYATVAPAYVTLAASLDRVNIMSYGMADNWGGGWLSWHSSALFGGTSQTPSSVDSSVRAYVTAGVPRAKLGVGAGLFGSCWQGTVTAPGQVPGTSKIVASDNDMSYANIVSRYLAPAVRRWDDVAKAPYLSSAGGIGPKKCNFVSYEDEQSLEAKGRYIAAQGLGGVIAWTINQGYLATPRNGEHNPLLQALKRGTMAAP